MLCSFREVIQHQGFDDSLEQLLIYARTQAKLHQLSGNREQWIFWVKKWANLQRAVDGITLGGDECNCLSLWQQYHQ